jgi:hypothetical protein
MNAAQLFWAISDIMKSMASIRLFERSDKLERFWRQLASKGIALIFLIIPTYY